LFCSEEEKWGLTVTELRIVREERRNGFGESGFFFAPSVLPLRFGVELLMPFLLLSCLRVTHLGRNLSSQ